MNAPRLDIERVISTIHCLQNGHLFNGVAPTLLSKCSPGECDVVSTKMGFSNVVDWTLKKSTDVLAVVLDKVASKSRPIGDWGAESIGV